MNDRLKFRVFGLCCNSKLEKNWVNITKVGNFLINKDSKLIDASAYFDPINHPEHFIIEQCTGLKDKNGNLIYENDVVKQTQYDFDPAKRRVVTGIIKWHPGHAQFVFEYPDGTDGHNISEIGWGIIEIIGNIHEQAEQKDKQ